MDLTTRCPGCGTAFKAGLADLQLRKGYIRCVQCSHIFDGYAEVVSDQPDNDNNSAVTQADPAKQGTPATSGPGATESGRTAGIEADYHPGGPQVFRPARQQGISQGSFSIGHSSQVSQGSEPRLGSLDDLTPSDDAHFSLGAIPHGRSDSFGDTRADADFSIGAMPHEQQPGSAAGPQLRRRSPMGTAGQEAAFVIEPRHDRRGSGGSAAPLIEEDGGIDWLDGLLRLGARTLLLALLLLLGAQLVYVYRAQIAQAVPALRPHLEQACAQLRCQVPYARNISRIAISSSSLKLDDSPQSADTQGDVTEGGAQDNAPQAKGQAPAGEQQQHFTLELGLRNQAAFAQEWPTLVLDLNDAAGTHIVRRNLSPAEYVGAALASQPFAAGSEVRIRVPMTLKGLQVNGYQLDLFFP